MKYTLIEEAKKRYSIGTKVKAIGSNRGGDFGYEVRFTKYEYFSGRNQLYVDGNLLIYQNGVWAEICEKPENIIENYQYLIKFFKKLGIK
jgi:hypothetical protein